jgi:hypothetical protein
MSDKTLDLMRQQIEDRVVEVIKKSGMLVLISTRMWARKFLMSIMFVHLKILLEDDWQQGRYHLPSSNHTTSTF